MTEELPDALRPAFYQDQERLRIWGAFQNKVGTDLDIPSRFDEIGEIIHSFIGPVRDSLVRAEPFTWIWPAGGPWQPGTDYHDGAEDDV